MLASFISGSNLARSTCDTAFQNVNHPLALWRSVGLTARPLLRSAQQSQDLSRSAREEESVSLLLSRLKNVSSVVVLRCHCVRKGGRRKKVTKMNSPKMNSPKMMMSPRLSNLRKYQFSDKLQTFNEKVQSTAFILEISNYIHIHCFILEILKGYAYSSSVQ